MEGDGLDGLARRFLGGKPRVVVGDQFIEVAGQGLGGVRPCTLDHVPVAVAGRQRHRVALPGWKLGQHGTQLGIDQRGTEPDDLAWTDHVAGGGAWLTTTASGSSGSCQARRS